MKDKERKRQLVESNKYREYKDKRYAFFKNSGISPTKDNLSELGLDNEQDYLNCEQMRNSDHQQVKKIKNHLNYWIREVMVKGDRDIQIGFATFTFDSSKRRKEMNATTLKTYITRALHNENVLDYVLNVDYGHENDRLHYHAILILKGNACEVSNIKRQTKKGLWIKGKNIKCDFLSDYENKVGFYDIEPMRDNKHSAIKLSKYITKLVRHSIKEKQSYISVKKGSEYQEYVKSKKKLEFEKSKKNGLSQLDYYKQDLYKYPFVCDQDKLQMLANIENERIEEIERKIKKVKKKRKLLLGFSSS